MPELPSHSLLWPLFLIVFAISFPLDAYSPYQASACGWEFACTCVCFPWVLFLALVFTLAQVKGIGGRDTKLRQERRGRRDIHSGTLLSQGLGISGSPGETPRCFFPKRQRTDIKWGEGLYLLSEDGVPLSILTPRLVCCLE